MNEESRSVRAKLAGFERPELEALVFQLGLTHRSLCHITSVDQGVHADDALMKERVAELPLEEIIDALVPFGVLGSIAHEHHPGHDSEHRRT